MITQRPHLEWCNRFRYEPYVYDDVHDRRITLGRPVLFLFSHYPLDPTTSYLLDLSVLVRSMDILI
jgi:hypothetical protein